MYRPQDVSNYTEESIKSGFKQLGYDDNIQNIMWNEYEEFVSGYFAKWPITVTHISSSGLKKRKFELTTKIN